MAEKYLKECLKGFQNYETKIIKERYVVNANESPFNIMEEERIKDILMDALKDFKLNLYPDPNANELREELAEYTNTSKENIICGNGGDEIISLIISTFVEPEDYVIVHGPSFEMYNIGTTINNGNIVKIPDRENYIIDSKEIVRKANEYNAKLIFLCVPNNPTGYLMPKDEIDYIIENTNCIIALDEAYIEFSSSKDINYLDNDRVIVIRTLSKLFGLAGLRIGYGIGNSNIINCLNKVKPPYNVNGITQRISIEILKNKDLILSRIEFFKDERDRMIRELEKNSYLKVYPSETNFILVRIDKERFDEIVDKLEKNSILAKIYKNRIELENCIRISVSTEEVNNLIIESFKV